MNPFENKEPTLIKVYSNTCGPCKQLNPVIDRIKEETSGVSFVALNGPQNLELCAEHGVKSVPTLFFVKDREIKGKIIGTVSYDKLKSLIKEYLLIE